MSESMIPGSISELVVSGEPAFRARFGGRAPPQNLIYWRHLVLWEFDGRRWSMAAPWAMPNARPHLTRASGVIAYDQVPEPTSQPWLYALDLPLAAPEGASLDGDFQFRAGQRVAKVARYRARSATELDTGPLDLDQDAAGFQLPDNVTPRMGVLVTQWQAAGGGCQVLVERALAHIRSGDYYYSLLAPALGDNPTDEFLFETRRGLCEHYASAFVLPMHIDGVPARVVVGYQGGRADDAGQLVSRQPGRGPRLGRGLAGWAGLGAGRSHRRCCAATHRAPGDPGPAGQSRPLRLALDQEDILVGAARGLRLLGATVRVAWQDWVLDFAVGRQERRLAAVGLGHLRAYGMAVAMLVVAGSLLGLLNLALVWGANRRDPLERIYPSFCDRLARIGLIRGPSEGPADYARRVVRRDRTWPGGMGFMGLYLPRRYRQGGGSAYPRPLKAQLPRFRPRQR